MSLRVVKPGEQVDPPKPRPVPATITGAVETGTSRDVLASMRKMLAKALDDGAVASNSLASTCAKVAELDALIRRADAEEAQAAKERDGNQSGPRRSFNASAV